MMRKLTVILLVTSLCLMGGVSVLAQKTYPTLVELAEYEKLTGKKIEKFNEAPMLRVKVAAGELPPVEERLPEEPLVVEPLEKIGRYGGTLRLAGTSDFQYDSHAAMWASSALFSSRGMEPYAVKNWEVSKDGKILTIRLRKGMKWSDGVPITKEDIEFWWNDILLNKELTPAFPEWLKSGKERARLEIVNDYTVRLHYPKPKPLVKYSIEIPASPKHYLKKFHIKYNPKADELAKEKGYTHWWELFKVHTETWAVKEDINLPRISPWVLKRKEPNYLIYERNPYFWQVDTAGNQLPYIDKIVVSIVSDREVYLMKAISGELSVAGANLSLSDYPLIKENAKKGDYRVLLWKGLFGEETHYSFNLCHKDPVLRKIFRDVRFKRALSLAINRDEINNSLFFGKATPRQSTVLPTHPYYEEKFAKAYAEYNPEKANALLDEMGLNWDKDHKWRLRPDGKPLSIVVLVPPTAGAANYMAVSELVKEYWEDVGVKTTLKQYNYTILCPRVAANDFDVIAQHMDEITEPYFFRWASWFVPYPYSWCFWANSWGYQWCMWYTSGGKGGQEPPEKIKHLQELKELMLSTTDEEVRAQAGKELLSAFAENLWTIGTVGMAPFPLTVKNNLRNVQEKDYWGFDYYYWVPSIVTQWFFQGK